MRSQASEGRDILGSKNRMKKYQYNIVGTPCVAKRRKGAMPDRRPFTPG